MKSALASILLIATAATDNFGIVVVDGDTIRKGAMTYRLTGYDTPETLFAKCEAERLLGLVAAKRLKTLIESNPIRLESENRQDKWGRHLGVLYIGEKNVSEIMIAEGLATPYDGSSKRRNWCERKQDQYDARRE